jgi:hypothetical protein
MDIRLIDSLILRWNGQGAEVQPGHSPEEIKEVFAKLGGKATSDVIDLYSRVGGMLDMENGALWRLWTLHEVVERNTEQSKYGLAFSDHLIDSWWYRIKPETADRSAVYIDYIDPQRPPTKLFEGINELLAALAENPNAVLG